MEKVFQSVEEILADEIFQAWYLKREAGRVLVWENWMETHPAQRPLVNEAVMCMQNILIAEGGVPDGQVEAASDRLMRTLAKSKRTPVVRLPVARKWWWAAAILILMAGGYFWLNANKRASIRSSYGQLQFQKLPDGTEVTLNANSAISFSAGWEKGKEREVWIDGEAYFHVRKTE